MKILLDIIDSVYIESDSPIINHERLYDEMDLYDNNGVFDVIIDFEPEVEIGLYNISFHVAYDQVEPYIDANQNGQWDEDESYTDINENGEYDQGETDLIYKELDIQFHPPTSPTIDIVCMPEIYTIDEVNPDTFYVYISVDDLNGIHDIQSVTLEMKKLEGYEIGVMDDESGVCNWEESVDEGYVDWDITLNYLLDYSLDDECEFLEGEIAHNYVHFTPLVIDSFSDCGPHGPISFKYIVRDNAGYITTSVHELLICWPGECE